MGTPQLPSLEIGARAELFRALLIWPRGTHSQSPANFGDARGWVVTSPVAARAILLNSEFPKGRDQQSQKIVGGYVSYGSKEFTRRRSGVIAALARAAADRGAMAQALSQTIPLWPQDHHERPAAFIQWMLRDLIGPNVNPIDRLLLLTGMKEMETSAEQAQAGQPLPPERSRTSALRGYLVHGAIRGSGAFTADLRQRGWSPEEIAGELGSLALAGWESTAAAVTAARSLGLSKAVTEKDIDHLLLHYPPSWLLVRKLDGLGSFGRQGELAVISPWLLNRSAVKVAPIPFGAGTRKCPAELYARTQIAVAMKAFGGTESADSAPVLLDRRSATLLPLTDWNTSWSQ